MPEFNEYADLFERVVHLAMEWKAEGENGHCLPVIKGSLLDDLIEAGEAKNADTLTYSELFGIMENE